MAKDGTRVIHALIMKLRVMAEVLHEKRLINRASLAALATYCGINPETLKSSQRCGRLSSTNEQAIAEALCFNCEHPAWVDTSVSPSRRSLVEGYDYPGRDVVVEFRHMLRSTHDLPSGEFVRLESRRPNLLDSNLAVLEMSDTGQSTPADKALQLLFSIILGCGYHDSGISFGFFRVRLRFVFESGSCARLHDRLGSKIEIEIANARLSARGGPHSPEWYLAIPDGVLRGEYVTNTDFLCELAGGKLGETFAAELSVHLFDSLLRAPEGSELPSREKQMIIEALFAQRLKDSTDSQGWLTLGRQMLKIVRAD